MLPATDQPVPRRTVLRLGAGAALAAAVPASGEPAAAAPAPPGPWTPRYTGVWSKIATAHRLRTGLTPAELTAAVDAQAAAGYRVCGLTGYVDYVYPNGPDTARYAVLFEQAAAQDQWFLAHRGLSWLPDVGGWHEGTMTGLTAVVSDGEVLYTAARQPHVGRSPYRTMNRTPADMQRVLEFTAQQGLRITALTATRVVGGEINFTVYASAGRVPQRLVHSEGAAAFTQAHAQRHAGGEGWLCSPRTSRAE